jgi:hypothetical protein
MKLNHKVDIQDNAVGGVLIELSPMWRVDLSMRFAFMEINNVCSLPTYINININMQNLILYCDQHGHVNRCSGIPLSGVLEATGMVWLPEQVIYPGFI